VWVVYATALSFVLALGILGAPLADVWFFLPIVAFIGYLNSRLIRVCPSCLALNSNQIFHALTHCRRCGTALQKNLS
ncbi:hypothetical protein K2X33_07155, partial [bacterium]|nr:hypothetical protein [bacterium]